MNWIDRNLIPLMVGVTLFGWIVAIVIEANRWATLP